VVAWLRLYVEVVAWERCVWLCRDWFRMAALRGSTRNSSLKESFWGEGNEKTIFEHLNTNPDGGSTNVYLISCGEPVGS
jgi:hypothetical protein